MAANEIGIRTATLEDCAVILHHRRSMFQDMGEGCAEDLDRMVEATSPWLAGALADGSYRGWLAEDHRGRVVGGGGVLVSSWPAGPKDPSTRRALIIKCLYRAGSPETRVGSPAYVVDDPVVEGAGFSSVVLHASDAGRHLYETLGFVPTNEMRLRLN